MPTGAQVIVAQLEDAGVEVCFGLPGVHNLAIWKALGESPIRLVGVRHEQAAAYAADGYARATGRLGVALTTTGPGAANTLGAVGEAWASRSPVLVIATDIPTTLRRPGVYRGLAPMKDKRRARFRFRSGEVIPGAFPSIEKPGEYRLHAVRWGGLGNKIGWLVAASSGRWRTVQLGHGERSRWLPLHCPISDYN